MTFINWLNKTNVRWTIIILAFLLGLICVGLLIWGVVILGIIHQQTSNIYTLHYWRIVGGLLVGICGFVFIIITINLLYFLNYHLQTKHELKQWIKKISIKKEQIMFNKDELNTLLKKDLENIDNEKKAIEVRNIFLKKHVSPLYDQLKSVPREDKKTFGQSLNALKESLEETFNTFMMKIKNAHDVLEVKKIIDWTNSDDYLLDGKPHLLNEMVKNVIAFFKQLNFKIESGNEVVTDQFNFENLNIPKNHPARNMQDSFFINDEWLLRTHCTVTTAQKIYHNLNNDIRILSYGNVYRRDDDDATHSHQFMQIDFVWINDNLNLANLKWVIDELIKYLFGQDSKTRYRLSFFPFTEPSFEVDVMCFKCKGTGCPLCKKSGWIEILGAGMLHQNVLNAADIYNKKGIAAGLGIERLAMLKYGINDIRDLYNNHYEINQQFKKI